MAPVHLLLFLAPSSLNPLVPSNSSGPPLTDPPVAEEGSDEDDDDDDDDWDDWLFPDDDDQGKQGRADRRTNVPSSYDSVL